MRKAHIERSDILNIRLYRERANLKQNELADMLHLTQSAIAKWETGEAVPRADKLPQLAKILNCSIEDLFDDKEVI
jgi:transcriptional regulator with XRE-family HTH domain